MRFLAMPRQAKEKSRGTWLELPLCDLEEKYKSPEARKWLHDTIVSSPVLRYHQFASHFFWMLFAIKKTNLLLPLLRTDWPEPSAGQSLNDHIHLIKFQPHISNVNFQRYWFACRIQGMSAWSYTRSLTATSTPAFTSIHTANKHGKARYLFFILRWTLQDRRIQHHCWRQGARQQSCQAELVRRRHLSTSWIWCSQCELSGGAAWCNTKAKNQAQSQEGRYKYGVYSNLDLEIWLIFIYPYWNCHCRW